ncbi:MAG: hypothetical protein K0U98_27095 [Deltaproteobacteria bacterium]|nr:hypothetical protein [Deltaproteobacteria bacterium]
MNPSLFRLRLVRQYWSSGSTDPRADREDATSHGKVELLVHGEDLSGCDDPDTDYGINQSSVRLLQTLFGDHSPTLYRPSSPHRSFDPVFYHGCTLFGTCPNCVLDYRVRHRPEGLVCLDSFHVSGGLSPADPDRFADRSVEVPLLQYANEVIPFAEQALSFLPVSRGADFEREMFDSLRKEHDFLLSMARKLAAGASLSVADRARGTAFEVETCQLPSE